MFSLYLHALNHIPGVKFEHRKDQKGKTEKKEGTHLTFHDRVLFYGASTKKNRREKRVRVRKRERERETERNSQTLISERSAMAASKDRENFVYIAKLAEQAERYEGFKFFHCFL